MISSYQSERRDLLTRLNSASSPADHLAVQQHAAAAILRSEELLELSDDADARHHVGQIRLYMDALVWNTLHPHAIRQLAKGYGTPPSLISQGPAFDLVMEAAHQWTVSTNVSALIADLTNIIKIGDLILVQHPEYPAIVECKSQLPKPQHFRQGRTGRQISRALGTVRYLSGKPTKIYGQDLPLVVVESAHRASRNWLAVERCVAAAMQQGESFEQISSYELIWAGPTGDTQGFVDRLAGLDKQLSTVDFVGSSLGALETSDGLFPPPAAWPIAADAQSALMEREIQLSHFVSGAAFEGDHHGARIAFADDSDRPLVVTLDDHEFALSSRLIFEVVYAFETVESAIEGIVAFAREVATLMPDQDSIGLELERHPDQLTRMGPDDSPEGTVLLKFGDHQLVVVEMPNLDPPVIPEPHNHPEQDM